MWVSIPLTPIVQNDNSENIWQHEETFIKMLSEKKGGCNNWSTH